MSKMRKLILIIIVSILLTSGLPASVNAIEKDNIPYDSYGIWTGKGKSQFVPQKATYLPEFRLTGLEMTSDGLSTPVNLAVSDDELFVLDSVNSRVIIIGTDYKTKTIIEKLIYNGENITFAEAEGIYVNDEGKIYIADTQGKRVLLLDRDGLVEKVITAPQSDIIPKNMDFLPIEVTEDENGYIYVLCKGNYYGAMVFDLNGQFQGFFGASRVGGSVFSLFGRLVDNIIGTDARREASLRTLPYEFSDICYINNFIYTASSTTKSGNGQIKKLGFSGENILSTYVGSAENMMFGDARWIMLSDGTYVTNRFYSLAVDDDGFIYALDSIYGKIFVYDAYCTLVSAFGGGLGSGIQKGTFQNASDIEVFNGNIVVLDRETASITAFKRTTYGEILYKAITLQQNGDYEKSQAVWEEILKLDGYNQIAYRGLANTYLFNSDYDKALSYAKMASDRNTYERAFEELRREFLQKNFIWVLLVVLLLVGGLVALVIYTNIHKDKILIKNKKINVYITTLIHPIESFKEVKLNNQGSVLIAGITIALYYILSVISITSGGFMYVSYDPSTYNSGLTLLGTSGIVLLWCLVNYLACTLFEGKGTMKEIFIVTGYALLPQLINSIFFIFGSYVFVFSESSIFQIVATISIIYTAVVLLIGLSVIHEYGFSKAILMSLVTIIGMAVSVFIMVLILTLFQDLFQFINGAAQELIYRYN